jgi:hypothetical protein
MMDEILARICPPYIPAEGRYWWLLGVVVAIGLILDSRSSRR